MTVQVHLDWQGEPHLVGRLFTAEKSVTFEYAPEWIKRAFAIDPTSLPLRAGPQHSSTLFGVFSDCGPDRWGRVLIERAVRKGVLARKPYHDLDYVLALDDMSRIGALRFRTADNEPFLSHGTGKVPPLVRLNALLRATEAIHGENETVQDLRFLLGEGSPLGGARPKSAVSLPDGRLAIAKFSKPDDVRDIAGGEILALTLAREAGIHVAEHRLVKVGTRHVAVIERFDRRRNDRIPFLSAASLLGLAAGERGAYTLLADGIRQFGHAIPKDLREMWRRMVFSLLISNYDDHPRNHAFLMEVAGRWSLSPAYDLNPVPEIDRAKVSQTAIAETLDEPSIAGALAAAPRFGLDTSEAKSILREVVRAVSKWREIGRRLHLKASTLDAYATAFEHTLSDEAARLVG